MARIERLPFEQALLDVILEEFSDVPCEQEIELTVSFKFQKMCEKLLRRARHGTVSHVSIAFRRAIIIAAIIAALITTAMAVPAIREAIIQFFVRNEGTHYEFSFDAEQAATAPDVAEKIYHATYIPEGYTEISRDVSFAGAFYMWSDEIGEDYIMFNQYIIPEENNSGPNAEGTATEILNLNGYEVFCVHDEGTMYYWTNNEYFFELYCGAKVSEEVMQQIFSGIEVDETAIIE